MQKTYPRYSQLIRPETTLIDVPKKQRKLSVKVFIMTLCEFILFIFWWNFFMIFSIILRIRISINNFDENVFWNTKSKTEKKAYYRHRLRKHLARELKSLHDGSRKLYKVRYEEATRIGTENLFIIKYEPSEKEHFHIYPPRYEECILHCHATCREILKGSDEWREYIRIEMNRYRQKFIRRYSGF